MDDRNPTQLQNFDNRKLAAVPEYRLVAQAMRDLVEAVSRAGIQVGYGEWPDAMRSLAAGVLFSDWCDKCRDIEGRTELDGDPVYAYRADDGAMVELGYLHNCGHAWTCHYALDNLD